MSGPSRQLVTLAEPESAEAEAYRRLRSSLIAELGEPLREAAAQQPLMLIIDDVQAGLGRTGQWFSWQNRGIEPDIATSAKALANGLPIGACMARQAVAAAFQPGDHGTTFGGGPVVCVAALAVLDEIEERDLLANCRSRSAQLVSGLEQIEGACVTS